MGVPGRTPGAGRIEPMPGRGAADGMPGRMPGEGDGRPPGMAGLPDCIGMEGRVMPGFCTPPRLGLCIACGRDTVGMFGRPAGICGRAAGICGRAVGICGRAAGICGRDIGIWGRAAGMAGRAAGIAGRDMPPAGRAIAPAGRPPALPPPGRAWAAPLGTPAVITATINAATTARAREVTVSLRGRADGGRW